MKKLFLALILCCLAEPVLAQGNPTCPTRPAGDRTNACASTAFVQGAISTETRLKLVANATFWVDDINGNDSNVCTSATTGACKTLIGAIAKIHAIDINGFAVNVNVAAPAVSYATLECLAPWVGLGTVTFAGNTATPTAVVIDGGASAAVNIQGGCQIYVEGFSLKSTLSNDIQVIGTTSIAVLGKMDFGDVCASCVQMYSTRQGYLESPAAITVHGNGGNFAQGSHGGQVRFTGVGSTTTWTGDSTYNNGTMAVDAGEIVGTGGATISDGGHTISGQRFVLVNTGLLQWASLTPPAPTAIPGNAPGSYGLVPAPGFLSFKITGVNFNSANTDNPIVIVLPALNVRYAVNTVNISNASHDLSTATAGLFTQPAGAGTAIVTGGSAVTVTATATETNNNFQAMTINNAGTEAYSATTLYFRIGTAEGAAATADVILVIKPLS